MKNTDSTRRRFLVESGTIAGAAWLAANAPMLLAAGQEAALQRQTGADWVHLAPREAQALAAVADQIIPPDDLPGGADIGVVHFIDQALGGFMAGEADTLRAGLADLDRRGQAAAPGSDGFAGLSFAQQTEILQEIESTPFFALMIFLTHCGLFAMPSWGGNRERAGWALLGFDDRHAWHPPFGYYDAQGLAGEDERGAAS